MIKYIVLFLGVAFLGVSCEDSQQPKVQKAPEAIVDMESEFSTIKSIMAEQEAAWSSGDIDAFMQAYLQSDSLRFIGSRGLSMGWNTTLENYKKGYPDQSTMGKLSFDILHLEALSPKACYMIGQYYLSREEKEDASGYFSLVWKKIDGSWKIVADHSSAG